MTRGWWNVKCLKAWINLKALEGVFVSPFFPRRPISRFPFLHILFQRRIKSISLECVVATWFLLNVIVLGAFFLSFAGCDKEGCMCVWDRAIETQREMAWVCANVCVCAWFMITCPFVEHINHSCKRNHGEMRNSFRALAGNRKSDIERSYTSWRSHAQPICILWKKRRSSFSSQCAPPFPSPFPLSVLWPRCHGCARTENNSRDGAW